MIDCFGWRKEKSGHRRWDEMVDLDFSFDLEPNCEEELDDYEAQRQEVNDELRLLQKEREVGKQVFVRRRFDDI